MVQKAYPGLFWAAMENLPPPIVSLIVALLLALAIAVFFWNLDRSGRSGPARRRRLFTEGDAP
jgi:hypothetical protein